MRLIFSLLLICVYAEARPRARESGVPFDGTPGPKNAITDVAGVEVGHKTLISGNSVRTGITAILPRGRASIDPVFAGWFAMNGNGELTGTTWIREGGFLEGPILFTNTHSVGVVRDAAIAWMIKKKYAEDTYSLPVVGETWDGYLNDIDGFHVKPQHVAEALDSARGGAVAEGGVGGGTGMICFEFKCGIGTSSREVKTDLGTYRVGTLVQANFGIRKNLMLAGIPLPLTKDSLVWTKDSGSILIVVATDAPLLPHQLERVAKRAAMGLARTGSIAGNSSGDLFLAFSTANAKSATPSAIATVKFLPNAAMDEIFQATVQSVEESIANSLFAGETMTGFKNHKVIGLPVNEALAILKRHGRLNPKP